jgi:hypothetical protein
MRDYLSFETTPYDEPCIQLGHELIQINSFYGSSLDETTT